MRLIKVVCYIRVSTTEQKLHGISLDAQRDKLQEYAKKHGMVIVEWYVDDGVSGTKPIKKRPALQRMLNDAKKGNFERILFIKLDRFFRSVAEYHECMKMIDPVVWTATEEKYDLSTANGRAFVNMKLTIAELEAHQTGERIDLVNEYKVKTGQAMTGSQSQGYGHTVKKIDGIKRVVKDPETAPIVEDFIQHFLTHQCRRTAYLYVKDKYNVDISYNTLYRLLKNPKIYGHHRGNDNYCEAYIDKETFDKIQKINTMNIKRTTTKRIYLFSGLIKCPKCGNLLAGKYTAPHNTKRGDKVYFNPHEYYGYKCNNYVINRECDFNKYLNEEKIENFLLDTLDIYVKEYIEVSEIEDTKQIDTHLEEKIQKVKNEMEKVKRMYRKDDITEDEYDKEMDELKHTLEELESRLEPVLERDLTIYHDLLKSDWRALYEALTKENERSFWRSILKGIEVDVNGIPQRPIFF